MENLNVKEIIRSAYPSMEDMPFCMELKKGQYTRKEILKSEVVELYRAIKTRTTIQDIYKKKLKEAIEKGFITDEDYKLMEEVIDDEGETEDHIDHIDMRYKLFTDTKIDNKSEPKFHQDCEKVNKAWMSVCEDSELLYLMAATAGIEDWYAPLSAFFEDEYRKRGFTEDELELFIVHKEADCDHSEAQFAILEKNKKHLDPEKLRQVVKRTFETSKAYDGLKKIFAEDSSKILDDYFM